MNEATKMVLKGILSQLHFIDLEELENGVKADQRSLSYADSTWGMLDPTGYRDAMYSGELEFVRVQAEILVHLRDVRKLMDEMQK